MSVSSPCFYRFVFVSFSPALPLPRHSGNFLPSFILDRWLTVNHVTYCTFRWQSNIEVRSNSKASVHPKKQKIPFNLPMLSHFYTPETKCLHLVLLWNAAHLRQGTQTSSLEEPKFNGELRVNSKHLLYCIEKRQNGTHWKPWVASEKKNLLIHFLSLI